MISIWSHMMTQKGFAHYDEGALVVDVAEETDKKEIPPCMILKSDGAALYDTTDLATLVEREKLYDPDQVIYVVDKRQELHFVQVFRCAKKTGIVKPETELTFLGFGTMNGKDGKPFKTREGGVMRLENLIREIDDEMYKKIMDNRTVEEEDARRTAEEVEDEDQEETGDSMKLTSIQSITDFMNCAGRTLPDNIRLWARRNLAVARSHEVSPEERRHAQRALSMMMNIQWKSNYFEAIDPVEARRILDEELYGMERVKQRIIETIIQINRTHTLPAYGLLLIGPAGTGKSQIAYAVARILKLPWTTLDMSSINDQEQLTGSSRIYANAKPGIIMDAFSMAL